METLLMIVTVIALALAIGMSVLAWRLLREHRLRADARTEMLQELAAHDAGDGRFAELEADTAEPWDLSLERDEPPVIAAAKPPRHPRAAVPVSDAMFAATVPNAPRPASRRWLAFAVAGIAIAAVVAALYTSSRPSFAAESAISQWMPELHASTPRPLELLSLRHASEAGTFVVTGLVQNPPGGSAVRKAIAVVYLFDGDGNYFAAGKGSLDFDVLGPGDESPFVVRVPTGTRVSRYRVGFRSEEGGVIAHVDRRGQSPGGTTGDSLDPADSPRAAAIRGTESRP
jgi:hypothetical protein